MGGGRGGRGKAEDQPRTNDGIAGTKSFGARRGRTCLPLWTAKISLNEGRGGLRGAEQDDQLSIEEEEEGKEPARASERAG